MDTPDLSRLKIDRTRTAPARSRAGSRWRRLLVPASLVVAALVAAAVVYYRLAAAPSEVETVTVTMAYPSQSFTVLNATGYVVAQRKAAVASKATGRLIWLGVQEGSRVRRDDVIARLEDLDVKATREQAAANVQVARANLAQGQAEQKDAETALRRSQGLLAEGFVSQASHDIAVARYNKSTAQIASLQAAIAAAAANLRGAQVAVEQTLIRAPFDGVVLTKAANVGDIVTPFSSALDSKGAVVTMADMTTLEVEADVSESSLSRVHIGQPVEIQLDALPDKRFRGEVSRTVPTVDRSKATVMTKIRFLEPDARVLPEMSAKAAFLSKEVDDAERTARPAVNPAAITNRGGRDVVFVVKEGKLAEMPIETGAKIGDLVEIRRGPQPGEKVVLRPLEKLHDGTAVKSATK
ncbi:MAG: efflux RND transporter periplasmic adaptor subunit [Betaproteobacteria bacterium]|nr:efflux RND transporter periplasmic adaptor subunit [Betaproteobacteria bacterium]